jgi:Ca2+-binding RTX toxin-like protein
MAFFDADLSVDNSHLEELKLLVENKVEVYKKKDILYYEKDNTTVGVLGQVKEKSDGTLTGKVLAVAVTQTDNDDPVWDVSNFKYDAAKLENQLKKDEFQKISATLFQDKDTVWGSHFDDTLYGFDGADVINGWRGHDSLFGGKGKDDLTGQIGDDRLNGGQGKDVLKGGADSDTFIFDQKLTKDNADTIDKFYIHEDSIELKQSIFTEFEKGKLHEDQFTIGKEAVGDNAQVIYQKSKGHLLYDPDGTGPEKALKFATMPHDKDLTHDLFFVA